MKIANTLRPAVCAAALLCAALSTQAATITVSSRDPAGIGFNDPTPVAPVGGNNGTTLGEQRLNVYKFVAGLWGAALQSNVPITVSAGWEALSCNSTQAVLGSAGALNVWSDFPGAIKTGTWYPQALANKLAGTNLNTDADDGSGFSTVDIKTQFNINLGNTGCLDGVPFYLGLDGKAGAKVNFMTTLLHELGHGLGFSVLTTSTSSGNRLKADGSGLSADGLPSIWEGFMFDATLGTTWLNTTTSAQRKASAINTGKLSWNGPMVMAGVQTTLQLPTVFTVATGSQTAAFTMGRAQFGGATVAPKSFGALFDTKSIGCDPFSASAAAAMAGKVALIDRGTCAFVIKVKNAQTAGATGVLLVNNAAGVLDPSGADDTVTIPAVLISLADGTTVRSMIASAAKYGSRSTPGMATSQLLLNTAATRAGADSAGRLLLYTPNPLVGGSSVSHTDISAFPNQLMEPNISADLTNSLVPPLDLTLPLLKDIGW